LEIILNLLQDNDNTLVFTSKEWGKSNKTSQWGQR